MKQSLMIDLEGHQLSDLERSLLAHPMVSAVLLFSRNFNSRDQLIALINSVRAINKQIIIAVDQEGGYVQRLIRHGFRQLPALRILGELYDRNSELACQMAKYYARIMATELLECGINLCLAPVIDLHGSSVVIAGLDRAFHSDPDVVAALAEAYIEGMRAAGLPSVAKHFPGHGSCDADSHITKPICTRSLSELKGRDLKPFEHLIERGKLDMVMPAHVLYPDVDVEYCAGYSEIWLKDILRTQLGFNGVIISDCISMAGADIGDLYTRAKRAFLAGCNMVIVANQPREALISLLDELQSGCDGDGAISNTKYLNRTTSV